MNSVRFKIQDQDITVKLANEEAGTFWRTAEVNEVPLQYHLKEDHILLPGHSHRLSYRYDSAGRLETIVIDGWSIPIDASSHAPGTPKSMKGLGAKTKCSTANNIGEVFAPLNGQVISILRKKGEHISGGEKVLVLESMKMENEVIAPVSGEMQRLEVEEGAIVSAGQLLFVLKPANKT